MGTINRSKENVQNHLFEQIKVFKKMLTGFLLSSHCFLLACFFHYSLAFSLIYIDQEPGTGYLSCLLPLPTLLGHSALVGWYIIFVINFKLKKLVSDERVATVWRFADFIVQDNKRFLLFLFLLKTSKSATEFSAYIFTWKRSANQWKKIYIA